MEETTSQVPVQLTLAPEGVQPKVNADKEEQKSGQAVLMTAQLMELKITNKFAEKNLTISSLETRALGIVINEDNLKVMAAFLDDVDTMEEMALETVQDIQKPLSDGVKACVDGKKLVVFELERLRGMVKPGYDRILAGVDTRAFNAAKKAATDKAIKKGIEETAAALAKKIGAATTVKELSDVERLLNLQKSPSRKNKYGDFHQEAIKKFDQLLVPVIKQQKKKILKLTALTGELEEAVSDRETEVVEKLQGSIEVISSEIRQNQTTIEDTVLSQEFFPVEEVQEILPEYRVKRTDISFELADVDVALKKVRHLLIIELDNKAIRKVAAAMKKAGLFDGKDELIVDGIKYIITRQREAL